MHVLLRFQMANILSRLMLKENRQAQADFECVECGYTENADVVGALNVLARGRVVVQA